MPVENFPLGESTLKRAFDLKITFCGNPETILARTSLAEMGDGGSAGAGIILGAQPFSNRETEQITKMDSNRILAIIFLSKEIKRNKPYEELLKNYYRRRSNFFRSDSLLGFSLRAR